MIKAGRPVGYKWLSGVLRMEQNKITWGMDKMPDDWNYKKDMKQCKSW